jgi:hypothetical protein
MMAKRTQSKRMSVSSPILDLTLGGMEWTRAKQIPHARSNAFLSIVLHRAGNRRVASGFDSLHWLGEVTVAQASHNLVAGRVDRSPQ